MISNLLFIYLLYIVNFVMYYRNYKNLKHLIIKLLNLTKCNFAISILLALVCVRRL